MWFVSAWLIFSLSVLCTLLTPRFAIESPYQPPKHFEPSVVAPHPARPYSIEDSILVFLKWLAICAVSAAPSFVLGLILEGANAAAIAGMVCGVLCYVIAYTGFEHLRYVRHLMRDRVVRRTAKIGYGTRIAISVLFPIGFYLDMFVGLVSVSFGGWFMMLFGRDGPVQEGQGDFLSHFVLTVVQGACLNVILLVYMLVVYAIARALMHPSPTEDILS